jgi:hypothetical protein
MLKLFEIDSKFLNKLCLLRSWRGITPVLTYQFKATIWIQQAACGLLDGFAGWGGGAPFPWELRPRIGLKR